MASKIFSITPDFSSPNRQYFALPYSTICYITENPSSTKGYQKLIQTCKYFFSKKKIVIFDKSITFKQKPKSCEPASSCIYWLTKGLLYTDIAFAVFKRHIYRCDLTELWVFNQDLSMNELDFLVSNQNLQSFFSTNSNFTNSNDSSPITIDMILTKIPNVTDFGYDNRCEIYSTKTFEKLSSLKLNGKKICNFGMVISKLSKIFDPSLFCKFIESNTDNTEGIFTLKFRFNISKEFLNTLQKEFNQFRLKTGIFIDVVFIE